jgi:hypothetical protein
VKGLFHHKFFFDPQPAEVTYYVHRAHLFDEEKYSATILSLAYHHGYLTFSNEVDQSALCPHLEFKKISLLETLPDSNRNRNRNTRVIS